MMNAPKNISHPKHSNNSKRSSRSGCVHIVSIVSFRVKFLRDRAIGANMIHTKAILMNVSLRNTPMHSRRFSIMLLFNTFYTHSLKMPTPMPSRSMWHSRVIFPLAWHPTEWMSGAIRNFSTVAVRRVHRRTHSRLMVRIGASLHTTGK